MAKKHTLQKNQKKTPNELKKEFVEKIKEIVESKKKDLKFEINKSKTTGITIWLVCKGDRKDTKKSLSECFKGVDFINKYGDFEKKGHSIPVTQITGKEPYNKSTIKVNIIYKSASEGKLKITTAEQEQIALEILKHKISGKICTWKSFDEMWEDKTSGLQRIYTKTKDISVLGDWYKHFVLIFNDVSTTPKIPTGKYTVFSQSDGFMDWVSKKVSKDFGITKKDSWNPADVWLIKDAQTEKKYMELINRYTTDSTMGSSLKQHNGYKNGIQIVNRILQNAYHKRDIVGISLKKNNGKKLFYEETNLNRAGATKQQVPGATFEKISLDLTLSPDKKDKEKLIFSRTATVFIKEFGRYGYKLAIKSNTGSVGNVTYEFLKTTGATAMEGKVPKDLLKKLLSDTDRDKMPESSDYKGKSFSDLKMKDKLSKISRHLGGVKDIDDFLKNLEISWEEKEQTSTNFAIIQIIDFLYILAKVKSGSKGDEKLDNFLTKLLYMSQKKNMVGQDRYGPFGKLY